MQEGHSIAVTALASIRKCCPARFATTESRGTISRVSHKKRISDRDRIGCLLGQILPGRKEKRVRLVAEMMRQGKYANAKS